MEIRYGRKRKGIKRELDKKIEDWLESIHDEDVVGAIKNDLIVTGGAIASMLLGEKVNDFDVYFRTKETTVMVAKYYVDAFNQAKAIETGDGVVDYQPIVKEESVSNIKGEKEDRVLIWMKSAGIAAEEQSTYEYFEQQSESSLVEFSESLAEDVGNNEKPRYRPVFLSDNAITLSDKIQIVIRFYGEPDQIHNNYDFVHATCYYDYGQKNIVLKPDAMEALLSRTLLYRGSLYPIASIFRTKKFIERGWRITAGELLKIMWQISEIDLTDKSILREQLVGVDMAYMHELIEALKTVDQEKINSTYIAEIIDRIFE